MRQFQVPQFITVEDKVFGPFTIKQFLYLGGGALLILGARALLLPLLFWPVALFLGALAASFAFLKVNEQTFPVVFRNWIFYLLRPRLYIWKKEAPIFRKEAVKKVPGPGTLIKTIPKISQSKLTDLAWSLDIKAKR